MPVAVITGATKGIGRAIAEKLLANGFDVAVCARSTNTLRTLHQQWEQTYPGAKIFMQNVDVSNKVQVKDFARNVLNNMGRVDVLVNNAGLFLPGKLAAEPEDQLEQLMATNVYSAYHLSRALLPAMKQQGSGHIFNITSVAALKAYENGGAYSVTKYALLGFSENLRHELRHEGIKVTAISPGAVYTGSWDGSGIAPGRIMQPDDVADVLWAAYGLSQQANVEHIVLRPQLGDL
ncbi:MAG: SDR family oxidoreductase [Edaphocola sp.]